MRGARPGNVVAIAARISSRDAGIPAVVDDLKPDSPLHVDGVRRRDSPEQVAVSRAVCEPTIPSQVRRAERSGAGCSRAASCERSRVARRFAERSCSRSDPSPSERHYALGRLRRRKPYANICSPSGSDGSTPRSVPSRQSQGSELMAMRTVSKTVNPGSNPGSPALTAPTRSTGPSTPSSAASSSGSPRTWPRRSATPASARGWRWCARCTSPPAVWINDDEPGLQADALEWLDKVAPPSWQEPDDEVARELLPESRRLPPPPRRRGQRRRPPEEPARPPSGDRSGHRRASSTSGRGSRSSTASSTAGGPSGS